MNYQRNAKNKYGKWLRKARQKANMTVRELAKRIGVDHSYVSRIELGRVPPPFGHKMVLIARELESPNLAKLGEYALLEYLLKQNASLLAEFDALSPALRKELNLDEQWRHRCQHLQHDLQIAFEKRTKTLT
jgi:transcriptional regulator with XRE-family HTH domain